MMDAAVWRCSLTSLAGARRAMKAKERKRPHVSVQGSARARSISLDKLSAAEARAAFGILLIIVQVLRNLARSSARFPRGVPAG